MPFAISKCAARAIGVIAIFCGSAVATDPALTIYNQNFAVVREILPLDLQAGANTVRFSGASAHVEPDSVILRDPSGKHTIQILEQNYRADAITQALLLSLFEGKTIEFEGRLNDGSSGVVKGKIIRSGYVPHYGAYQRYGPQYQYAQNVSGTEQPVIEVDGKLQFSLPGQPIFPTLGADTILKPTLDWIIHSGERAKFDAELSYVSGGMSWSADYNAVAPENGETLELAGWVTLDNQSGKQFDHAHIKLMAGDVSKIQPGAAVNGYETGANASGLIIGSKVTERSFDEYHLYTLPNPTTLHDRETKQVEFLRASSISAKRLYVYDGAAPDNRYGNGADVRFQPDYGSRSNPNVWTMMEFANSAANHLGMPLPAGRMRFYRRDADGQLEFIGENEIRHTPKDEQVRLYTGNAFDISGERRQTNYTSDQSRRFVDESFEIKLRNHKKEPVTVRVVEHLYRWSNWTIATSSDPYRKADSRTIEFEVTIPADAEKTVTYLAHYTW